MKPGAAVTRQVLPVGMVTVCVGCGCDDLHACAGGCSWLRVDREAGVGVCSNCGDKLDAWDRRAPLKSVLNGFCPDCRGRRFLKGPEGGLCTNIQCAKCGSEFNVCPRCTMLPQGFVERIEAARRGA